MNIAVGDNITTRRVPQFLFLRRLSFQCFKTFKKVRNETKLFDHLEPLQRSPFHEIRSLGGRLMKKEGYTKEQIQGFYGHTHQKTSDRYLDDPGSIAG